MEKLLTSNTATQTVTPSTTTPKPTSTSGAATGASSQQNQQLANTFYQIMQQMQMKQKQPQLQHLLSTEMMVKFVREHPETLELLIPHLPEGTPKDLQSVLKHIQSAQFRQAISVFNAALNETGDMRSFLVSFGLPFDPNDVSGGSF